MKTKLLFIVIVAAFLSGTRVIAQDQDFHIYLCFGQSNMEGAARIEPQDTTVDGRFLVMETLDCPNLGRVKGGWYPAIPPLCRCRTGLSPADYFGRTMVEHLPKNIRVGVINVSIGGCKIQLFDKDNYREYVSTAPGWMVPMISSYDGNPYARLVEMAKLAQKDGVIKGILMHQGESDNGDTTWPGKVRLVYENLLKDLDLQPEKVPFLAGEMVSAAEGGLCADMNAIIATLPQTIPNSWVISSEGCPGTPDHLHFTPEGYRILGRRYADRMLSLLGYNIDVP